MMNDNADALWTTFSRATFDYKRGIVLVSRLFRLREKLPGKLNKVLRKDSTLDLETSRLLLKISIDRQLVEPPTKINTSDIRQANDLR